MSAAPSLRRVFAGPIAWAVHFIAIDAWVGTASAVLALAAILAQAAPALLARRAAEAVSAA